MRELKSVTPKLIGIAGAKGAGKDTIAKFLCQQHAFVRNAFADPFKDALAVMFRVDRNVFDDPALKEQPHPALCGRTPRYLMQTIGTEWGRNMVDPEIWNFLMDRWLADQHTAGNFLIVISDVREDNEAEMIHARGGVIWHVVRPGGTGYSTNDSHSSEISIRSDLIDERLTNNYTPEMLYVQAGIALSRLDD